MRPELEAITLAAGTAGVVGLAGAAITLLVARRSPALATLLGPLVGVVSVAAGVAVTARAMFLSEHDSALIALVLLAAAPVALAIGALLYRSVRHLDRGAQQRVDDERRDADLARSRQQMVSWASHDLRTPLSAIRVMAEALEDGVTADPDDYHRRIRAEADRMTVMVDDLLEMTRISSGTAAGPAQVLDLAEVAAGVVRGQQPVAQDRDVRLSVSAVGPAPVRAVAGHLERVVANVVSNAVRESEPGGEVTVEVLGVGDRGGAGDTGGAGAGADERGSALVLLRVADSCGGVAEADLEKVFEPGWRGSTARSGNAGAGVGLTIARALVQEAGGSIDLRNVGPGCLVTISLPEAAGAADGHTRARA